MACRYADVRRFIDFGALVFLARPGGRDPASQVLRTIQDFLKVLPNRRLCTLGYAYQNGMWAPTTESKQHAQAVLALDYALRNIFQLPDTFAVRLGRGLSRFPAFADADHSVVIWWQRDIGNANIGTTERPA